MPVNKSKEWHHHKKPVPTAPAADNSGLSFDLSPQKMNPQKELELLRKQHEQLKKLGVLEQQLKKTGMTSSNSEGQTAKENPKDFEKAEGARPPTSVSTPRLPPSSAAFEGSSATASHGRLCASSSSS